MQYYFMALIDLKSNLAGTNQKFNSLDLSKLKSNLENFSTSYPLVNLATINSVIPHSVSQFNDAIDLAGVVTTLEKAGTSITPFSKIQ